MWRGGVRGEEAFPTTLHSFLLGLQMGHLVPENLGYIPEPESSTNSSFLASQESGIQDR